MLASKPKPKSDSDNQQARCLLRLVSLPAARQDPKLFFHVIFRVSRAQFASTQAGKVESSESLPLFMKFSVYSVYYELMKGERALFVIIQSERSKVGDCWRPAHRIPATVRSSLDCWISR